MEGGLAQSLCDGRQDNFRAVFGCNLISHQQWAAFCHCGLDLCCSIGVHMKTTQVVQPKCVQSLSVFSVTISVTFAYSMCRLTVPAAYKPFISVPSRHGMSHVEMIFLSYFLTQGRRTLFILAAEDKNSHRDVATFSFLIPWYMHADSLSINTEDKFRIRSNCDWFQCFC